MTQEQKIWVLFHDESDLQPYLITLNHSATVTELKRAIKQAFPNRLRLVDAGSLKIYAAGANPDDASVEPLRPGTRLQDVLTAANSDDSPLVVVAPESSQPSQGGKFCIFVLLRCSDYFFNDIVYLHCCFRFSDHFADLKALAADVAEIKEMLSERRTENKSMSKATANFAKALFGDLGISLVDENHDGDDGSRKDPEVFPWEDAQREETRPEPRETETFGIWLQGELFPQDSPLGIVKVGQNLPPVVAGNRSSTGKVDLCVGEKDTLKFLKSKGPVFSQVQGIVEIKTTKAEVKLPQLHLELAAVARESRYKKGVVALGTDGNAHWLISRFRKYNVIATQTFTHGAKCLEEYRKLLDSIELRRDELLADQAHVTGEASPGLAVVP